MSLNSLKDSFLNRIMQLIRDKRILYLGIVVGLIPSVIIVNTLYREKVQSWKQQAGYMFKQSLEIELQERDTAFLHYKVFTGQSNLSLDSRPSETIKLMTDSGEREYVVPKEKYENSLVKETLKRCIISYILEDTPLIPDTLNAIWDSLLVASGVSMNSYARISVTDMDGCTSVGYSKGVLESLPADSLLTYYLGERCEVEATAYVSYGWWAVFGIWEYLLFFLLWIIIMLLFIMSKSIILMLKEKLNAHAPIIIETKVPVIAVGIQEPHVYQLEDGVFFDAEQKVLSNSVKNIAMRTQAVGLLELFLKSKDCRLSISEIDKSLWPDGSGTGDRIHSAISRLRSPLSEVTHLYIEYKNGVYQLKSSICDKRMKERI